MKYKTIGIDIDDTIANTNELIVVEADKYDKEVLGGTGIKDPLAYEFTKMMGWKEDGRGIFFNDRLEHIFINTTPKENSVEVINKLYDEGYTILFISFRKDKYVANPYELTTSWLKKYGYKYTKLFVNTGTKEDECINNHVDLFIDDMPNHCEDVNKVGIDVILFDSMYNKDEKRYKRANNWLEIYDIIHSK